MGGSLRIKLERLLRKGRSRQGPESRDALILVLIFFIFLGSLRPLRKPHSPLFTPYTRSSPSSPPAQTIPVTPGSPGMCVPVQLKQKPCAAGTCAQGHGQGEQSGHYGNEGPPPARAPQGSAPGSYSGPPGERKGSGKYEGTVPSPPILCVSSLHPMTCCGLGIRILWVSAYLDQL